MEILEGLKIITVRHRSSCKAFKMLRPEAPFHDLTIVFKGELRYNIDGKDITVKPGEAMYCPAGAFMSREDSTEPTTYVSINFNKKVNDPLFFDYHLKNILSFETNSYLDTIYHVLKKPSVHNSYKIFCLVSLILTCILEQQKITQPLPHIDRAKMYIKENFRSDIVLDSVASFVGLHPSYLSTIFKRSEGMSVTEYINVLRINQARELLEISDYRIGEIGELCGIPDPYYFSRVFSKICGTSPSEYRKIANSYGGTQVSFKP